MKENDQKYQKEEESEDIETFEEADIYENVDSDGGMDVDAYADDEDEDEGPDADQIIFEDNSIQAFFGHDNQPVYCIDLFQPQSTPLNESSQILACSGGGDDLAHVWRVDNGESIRSALKGHTDSVSAVQFSPDGRFVATGGLDGQVLVHSVAVTSSSALLKLDGPAEVNWLRWWRGRSVVSSDDSSEYCLACGSSDGGVWIWTLSNSATDFYDVKSFYKHSGPVSVGEFIPFSTSTSSGAAAGDRKLLTASEDGSLVLWDLGPESAAKGGDASKWKLQPNPTNKMWHDCGILSLAISHDGKIAATGDERGNLRIIQVQTGKILARMDGAHGTNGDEGAAVEGLAFDDGKLNVLASAGMDGKVILWDLKTNKPRSTLQHADGVNHLQFVTAANNQQLLVCASIDQLVTVWDYRSGGKVAELKGHQELLNDFACRGDLCVTAGDDGVCLVFPLSASATL